MSKPITVIPKEWQASKVHWLWQNVSLQSITSNNYYSNFINLNDKLVKTKHGPLLIILIIPLMTLLSIKNIRNQSSNQPNNSSCNQMHSQYTKLSEISTFIKKWSNFNVKKAYVDIYQGFNKLNNLDYQHCSLRQVWLTVLKIQHLLPRHSKHVYSATLMCMEAHIL